MTNHEMRRSDRMLSEAEAKQLLTNGEYGILATIGQDGYPYGVPLSYAYEDGKIYFHGAAGVGHKFENMNFCDRVSFTVVGNTQVLPDKFATKYESVVVFGRVKPVSDKLEALERIRMKYSPDFEKTGKKYEKAAEKKVDVYEIQIEKISGKARKK